MRLLFLDIDGVLNNGKPTASGYCTIDYDKALLLNELLDTLPDVKVVISSAWRYLVLTRQMTIGFANIFVGITMILLGIIALFRYGVKK